MPSLKITGKTKVFGTLTIPPYVTPPPDSSTSLLLKGEGQGGIIDSTGKNIITTRGNVTISTSVKKYGSSSIYFDASSNTKAWMPISSDFAYGLDPFTVEFWINPVGAKNGMVYSQSPEGFNYFVISIYGNRIYFTDGTSNSTPRVGSSASLPLGVWSHVALVREGTGTNQTKIYINGDVSLGGIGTCSYNFNATSGNGFNPTVGGYYHDSYGGELINAYIDDLRISKGIARYTSNFTPIEV